MTQLTPALDAALSSISYTVFGALALDLPSGSVNLIDGSAVVSFGGRTYSGRNDTFGVLGACEALSDGFGDTAPSLKVTYLVPSAEAAAAMAAPEVQGSLAMLYIGALDAATGLPIPDPYLLGLFEVDVPEINNGAAGRSVDLTLVSVMERCFVDDEGQRLAPGRQRAIYTSDAGLDDVTGVTYPVSWGVVGDNAIAFTGRGGIGAAFNGYLV